MNDTPDELRRAVDFTFRALHDAATMSDRLEHYARADGDRAAELAKQIRDLNERIDKVAEIIGERVSGLVDEIAAVRDSAKLAHERLDAMLGVGDLAQAYHAGFPTGGAHTAEAATDAVLPVPQRGDRVRLEGLLNKEVLRDGWYDVVGVTEWGVQIENGFDGYGTKKLYNVERSHVKEVRHAPHNA